MEIFKELKRRNVFRVAVAYAVISWLLIQVADTLTPALRLPEWIVSAIALVLILGFVPVLLFSWAYEITPEGIKKETEVVKTESVTAETAKKLDIITLIALLGVAALVLYQQYQPKVLIANTEAAISSNSQMPNQTSSLPDDKEAPEQSIAVLAFIALSDEQDDKYFGKGIAEELLNKLAKFPELKVAARTSAFSFSNKDVDLREVGRQLGVAHVLEGSIRRSGDDIRVTAQLIRSADGFHLWSETYQRKLTDIFGVQDEIVQQISTVLQFQLGVGAGQGRASKQNVNPKAYEQYMRGLDLWWNRNDDDIREQALIAFQNTTELDKDFADGWAAYANALALSGPTKIPGVSADRYTAVLENALQKAFALDSDNVQAHTAAVPFYSMKVMDFKRASFHLEKALEVAPSSASVQYVASNFYSLIGDLVKAKQAKNRAMNLDPLNLVVSRTAFELLSMMDSFEEAYPLIEDRNTCQPPSCGMLHFITAHTVVVSAYISEPLDSVKIYFDEWLFKTEQVQPLPNTPAAFAEFIQNYFIGVYKDPNNVSKEYWDNVDYSGWLFYQNAVLTASVFAQRDQTDKAFDLLNKAYTKNSIFNSPQSEYFITPGRWEFPETIRRDQRYHDFWNLPGMAELAKMRRKNGVTAGLPLPIEKN